MQYGLSEKSAGAVKTVLAAAGVVLDAFKCRLCSIFAHLLDLEYNSKWSEKSTDWSGME